ncbi:MAG: peptide-methionine (S)-S-oxide reductase MsrA, partial [Candidatus Eiseniibacteriota bacterium]
MKSAATLLVLTFAGLALAISGSSASSAAPQKSAGATPAMSATAAPQKSATAMHAAAADSIQHATFGLGCFWSGQSTFDRRPGVISVTAGYTGGTKVNPTYEEVSAGSTGHYESIDIVYDASKTSYAKLLDIFWHNIDPTQGDGQFCDRGPEYPSMVFYHDESQHQLALRSKQQIEASGQLKKPIVTKIVAANAFYP